MAAVELVDAAAVRRSVRVVLADGRTLVRAGLRSILARDTGIEVVGEAADGAKAVRLARRRAPDVVLLDGSCPAGDVAAVTEVIRATTVAQVMVLGAAATDDHVHAALRAGAAGYLLGDTEPDELVHAVRVVARGDAVIAPAVTRRLLAELTARPPRPDPAPRLRSLTAREAEVLALVAAGLSNHEIAERLVVSPATAKTHVSRIMAKTHVRDRAQLVVLAYETGHAVPGWLTRG